MQQIKLNNIIVTLPQHNNTNKNKKTVFPTFSIEKFEIDSQLNLADNWSGLDDFISEPITLHLEGSLKQNEQETVVNLNEISSITVNNIAISKASTQKEESTAAINTENILRLKTLTTSLNGSVKVLKNSTISLNLKLHSQASHVNIQPVLQLKSLDFFSDVKGNFDDIQINTTVQADGIDLGNIELTGAALTPKIVISATKLSLTDLLSLNIKLPTKVALIDGLLTYRISGQLANLTAIENTALSASIAITSVSGKINGIWLQDLNWQQDFTLHKGKITTQANDAKNLTMELIDSSIPIAKLSMNTHLTLNKDFKLYVNELKGNILGGSFYIPAIQWPLKLGRSVDVQLNAIDLAQVLALDKRQGIVVTGKISGQIPIIFNGKNYMIKEGELHNISNGVIQVMNNPAVVNLKANNSQLQLAFDALQNLQYNQLSSAVSLSDDGYMLLKTVIKGYNPDIDDDVNLNLNLNYDLLGLLESLSITERFENNLIKGLQKTKVIQTKEKK